MHHVSGITVFRCNTTRLARLVQTSAVNVRDYAFVGDNPIGMAHTSYGRFTYVNDAHGGAVYKMDNASNTVVGERSAPRRQYASRGGQDGPPGAPRLRDESNIRGASPPRVRYSRRFLSSAAAWRERDLVAGSFASPFSRPKSWIIPS